MPKLLHLRLDCLRVGINIAQEMLEFENMWIRSLMSHFAFAMRTICRS